MKVSEEISLLREIASKSLMWRGKVERFGCARGLVSSLGRDGVRGHGPECQRFGWGSILEPSWSLSGQSEVLGRAQATDLHQYFRCTPFQQSKEVQLKGKGCGVQ